MGGTGALAVEDGRYTDPELVARLEGLALAALAEFAELDAVGDTDGIDAADGIEAADAVGDRVEALV